MALSAQREQHRQGKTVRCLFLWGVGAEQQQTKGLAALYSFSGTLANGECRLQDLSVYVAVDVGLPPSMLNMGWEYPAHMLRPDGVGLQGAVPNTEQSRQAAEADQTVRYF